MPDRQDGSVAGRLLVAAPELVEPTFRRTVVLVLQHSAEGAFGLVLNRPSPASVADALPGWEEPASRPSAVFVGGPVEPGAAICLATAPGPMQPDGWRPITDRLGVLDLDGDPVLAAGAVTGLRVFAGYAGWSPGQLDEELAVGGWHVVRAVEDDVFSDRPEQLWSAVLRRQIGPLALLSTFPADPRLN